MVASVTPSTNPAATVINNAISPIAAGNSVIFCPASGGEKKSPSGRLRCSTRRLLPQVGRKNLLVTVANPDIETAQRLFKFPGIGLLVVTGGEAVVEAARKHTNKRLISPQALATRR